MKISTRYSILALALCALLAVPAMAQMTNPWDIEGDVDGDGEVGPTDVQHVVNQALGLSDEGPAAVNRNRRQFVVASPRAALMLAPDAAETCGTIGAAYNFPRQNARMLVRVNTGVRFRFDRNTEGVWYEDACGVLSTALTVEVAGIPEEGIDGVEDPDLVYGEGSSDSASGDSCGPALGTAAIAVPYIFNEAGDYLVRCTVTTSATPRSISEDEADVCGKAEAVDAVYVHVRVIDTTPTEEQLQWCADGTVEPIHHQYGELWRHGMAETTTD